MVTQPEVSRGSPTSGSVSRNARFETAFAIASRFMRAGAAARKRTTLVLAERTPTGAAVGASRSGGMQAEIPRAPLDDVARETQRARQPLALYPPAQSACQRRRVGPGNR